MTGLDSFSIRPSGRRKLITSTHHSCKSPTLVSGAICKDGGGLHLRSVSYRLSAGGGGRADLSRLPTGSDRRNAIHLLEHVSTSSRIFGLTGGANDGPQQPNARDRSTDATCRTRASEMSSLFPDELGRGTMYLKHHRWRRRYLDKISRQDGEERNQDEQFDFGNGLERTMLVANSDRARPSRVPRMG